MKKLENILNELKENLKNKIQILNTLLTSKEENDKNNLSVDQVLKNQELNSRICDTKYKITCLNEEIEKKENLIKEANDYVCNKSIMFEDFLTLCDIYDIKVPARTKGHLKSEL